MERLCHSGQDGFEHGQQGIGRTAAVVSEVTGSLTGSGIVRSAANQSPDPTSIAGAVDVFGDHGLCGLPEEGAHGKSPKCLDGNLGDFGDFAKVSRGVYSGRHIPVRD